MKEFADQVRVKLGKVLGAGLTGRGGFATLSPHDGVSSLEKGIVSPDFARIVELLDDMVEWGALPPRRSPLGGGQGPPGKQVVGEALRRPSSPETCFV